MRHQAKFIYFFLFLIAAIPPHALAQGQLIPLDSEMQKKIAANVQEMHEFLLEQTGYPLSNLETRNIESPSDWDSGFGIRTDAVLVIHQDHILYEEYFNGYQANMPHRLWSVGKSVSNAFIAMAVREGKIMLDSSICNYLSPLLLPNSQDICAISIDDIMHWSSGIDWTESYISLNPTNSSVIMMLYGDGQANMPFYILHRGLTHIPGTIWNYSSGDSNLLWAILRAVYSAQEYEALPWAKLFDRLGMENVTLERDGAGNFSGASHMIMRPRDLVKYAKFFLSNGDLQGEKVFPENWLAYSTGIAPAAVKARGIGHEAADKVPGAQWWVNRALPKFGIEKPWPSGPDDLFAGLGVFGQTLFIVPSQDLIVIRLGHDVMGGFDRDRLIAIAERMLQKLGEEE